MAKAKLANGCHMFVVSNNASGDGLAAAGDKLAYAAYIDWPVEGPDGAQVLSRHQAICAVTDIKSSSFVRNNICSSYFPFNQTGPTLSLALDDPHIRSLPVGGRVSHEDKSNFNFFPHYMKQVVCEPEITCLTSVDEISINIRQRPIDKLYTYLLAQVMHPPQPRIPKIDPNPLFNKKYNDTDLALLTFNQDLKRLILRQGPIETCMMLTQICTNERARYYVNHGYLESCAANQGGQTRQTNTSLNQSRMFGESRAGGASMFYHGESVAVESSLVILRTDSSVHSFALQLLVILGSYQTNEPGNDYTRNQTLNLNATRFENQVGFNFIERDRGAILNPQIVDHIRCSSLLSCCLYKYFARLMRPLWNSELFQIISEGKTGDQARSVRETVSSNALGLIIEGLVQFQLFLKANQANISEHRRSRDYDSYSKVPSGSQGMHSRPVHPDAQNISYIAAIVQLFNQTSQFGRLEQCELTETEIEVRRQIYGLIDKSIVALQVYKVLVENQDMLSKLKGSQLTQIVSIKVSNLILNPTSSELICHSLTLLLLSIRGIDAERRADRLTNNFMHHFTKSDAVFAISLRNLMRCIDQILNCNQHYFYRKSEILRGEFGPTVDQNLEENLHRYIKEVRNHPSSCKPLLLIDIILPLYTNSLSFKELFDLLANMVNDLSATMDRGANKNDLDRPSNIDLYNSIELNEIYWKQTISAVRNRIQIDQNTTLASFTKDKLVLILGTAVYLLNKLWNSIYEKEHPFKRGSSTGLARVASMLFGRNINGPEREAYDDNRYYYKSQSQSQIHDSTIAPHQLSFTGTTTDISIVKTKAIFDKLESPAAMRDLLGELLFTFCTTCTYPPAVCCVLNWALETKAIDLTPALGATCSRLIAEMSESMTITDSIAMSMRRLVPPIEARSRYILNKSLISQDNLPEFANYSDLIHLKHRLDYVEENLKILRQQSIDMSRDNLSSEISLMESYKNKLLFQRACLKSIKYRLVPRLAEANKTAVNSYGLTSRVSYQVEEIDILQYIKSRPELVQDHGWQKITDLIERLAFGVTDIGYIMNEVFENYNLRDIKAVYYIQFYSDSDAQTNFNSQVERDMRAMCQADYDLRRDDSIIIPQKEKEWPGNIFAYWEILAINCGRELAKYGLFDVVRITEKLCEDYLYQSGRHTEEVQNTILPGLSKADPTVDPYWLPFVLYRLRVLGIKELVELYEKVALSIINDLSPNPALRGCYLLRMINNLLNLGYILVDRVVDRKSLSIDTSSLMITQNNISIQNTDVRQPSGEERARLTASLLGSIRDVCMRIQNALDNHRAEVMHLKMYPITQRRQEKLESDIKSLNIEKSLATYNSKIF